MSNIADIAVTFQKASNEFDPIDSKPNNDDLQSLSKVLVIAALRITLTDNTTGCVSVVILPDTVYKKNNWDK